MKAEYFSDGQEFTVTHGSMPRHYLSLYIQLQVEQGLQRWYTSMVLGKEKSVCFF